MRTIFCIVNLVLLATVITYTQNKPDKPNLNLQGTWYYNTGGFAFPEYLESEDWQNYNGWPIKGNDTIVFIDSTTLKVNHSKQPKQYKLEYRSTPAGYSGTLKVDGYEYAVHAELNTIDLQYNYNDNKWSGKFKKAADTKKDMH